MKIEKKENRLKEISLGIGAIILYFVISNLESLPFDIAGINISYIPNYVKIFYLIVVQILLISSLLLVFNKKISNDYKDLLKNHKKYFGENIKYYLIGLAIMLISNCILIYGLSGDIANNEESVRALFKVNPFYVYISAVIFAPIIEELTFRLGFKNIFGKSIIFILSSGIIFGGMHVIGSASSLIDFLYIIPYSSLGIAFAYMLYKTDNIFVTMGFHFMHNGLLMAIQVLSLLFL